MIFLIRHGETLGNASRTVQRPDNPLSPRGLAQAERLAKRLEREGIAAIVSSDLARAAQTAEHLARVTGLPVEHDALLQERNFGDLRGTPYAELGLDMFAFDYAPPNGETWTVFHARVDRAWARVLGAAGGPGALAVVTHGLVCWSILSRHVTAADEPPASMRFGNTSLTILDGPTPWRAALVDCTAHLDGAGGRAGTRV